MALAIDKKVLQVLLTECLSASSVEFGRKFDYSMIFKDYHVDTNIYARTDFIQYALLNRLTLAKELSMMADIIRSVFRIEMDGVTLKKKLMDIYCGVFGGTSYDPNIYYRVVEGHVYAAYGLPKFILNVIELKYTELMDFTGDGEWIEVPQSDPNYQVLYKELYLYHGAVCKVRRGQTRTKPITKQHRPQDLVI